MASRTRAKGKSAAGLRRNQLQRQRQQAVAPISESNPTALQRRLGNHGTAQFLQAMTEAESEPVQSIPAPEQSPSPSPSMGQASMGQAHLQAMTEVESEPVQSMPAQEQSPPSAMGQAHLQAITEAEPELVQSMPEMEQGQSPPPEQLPPGVQARLTMGRAGDPFEREADMASSRVLAGKPVQTLSRIPPGGLLQTLEIKPEADGEQTVQSASAKPRPQAERGRSQADANFENRLQAPSGGHAMAPSMQQQMEESFNSDFSHVRLHSNTDARADTARLGAKAFTKGSHISLGSQASENDRGLMAHELAHVVQQGHSQQDQDQSPQSDGVQRAVQENTEYQGPIQTQLLQTQSETDSQDNQEEEEGGGILGAVVGFLREVPGYQLLSVIIGRDPITGSKVPRTAATIIRAIIGLIPGGEALFENLNKTGAIDRAGEWLDKQIELLGITWSFVKGLFLRAWDALSVFDLLLPFRAFKKVVQIFAEPVIRIGNFALSVGGKILEFIFQGALSLAGSAGEKVLGVLKSAGEVFLNIVRDPIGFLGNLITSLRQGFGNFSANIFAHLKTGLIGWLLGALAGTGLQLSQTFNLKGIVSLVLQVLGVTYAAIRKRIVKIIGEERMAKVEKTVSFVIDLVTRGPAAAWELISNAIGNLKDMVLGAIQDWVVTKVVKSAVTKLISMFNPVGAIIQAAIAIYNTVMFFIERAQQIASLFTAITNSISSIAAGALSAAATFIESSMARTLPVIISFLARLLGLSGIGETIKGVIKKIQRPISKGIDAVVSFVVKKASGLLGRGKKGQASPEHDRKVAAGLADIDKEERKVLDNGGITFQDAEVVAGTVKKRHGVFKEINVVDGGETWDYSYRASKGEKTGEKKADRDTVRSGNVVPNNIGPTRASVQSQLDNLPDSQGANFFVRQNSDGSFSAVRRDVTQSGPLGVTSEGNLFSPVSFGGGRGRLGNAQTRAQNQAVADELSNRGFTVTNIGRTEEFIPGAQGGTKGSVFIDITAKKNIGGNQRTLRVQTVDTLSDGITPTQRELDNAARARELLRSRGENPKILLVPK